MNERAPTPTIGGRARIAARATWLVVVAVVVIRYLSDNWGETSDYLNELALWMGVGTIVAVSAGKFLVAEQMRWSLHEAGRRFSVARAFWVYTVSDAAKYVPGGVWGVLARVQLYRDEAIPVRESARVFGLEKFWLVWSGLLSGIAFALPSLLSRGDARWDAVPTGATTATVGIVALAAVWIAGMWIAHRVALGHDPSPRSMAVIAAQQLGIAVLLGLSLWLPLATKLDAGDIPLAIGAFGVARSIGYVAFFAPAGIGVREVMVVWMLRGTVDTDDAILGAAANRALTTVAEAIGLSLVLGFMRRHRTPGHDQVSPTPESEDPSG